MKPTHLLLNPLRLAIKGSLLAAPLTVLPSAAQAMLTPLGNEFIVNETVAEDQFLLESGKNVAIQPDGDFIVVWNDEDGLDGDSYGVFGRLFNADGTPQTGEFQINTSTAGDQKNPAVATDAAGNFVVAWEGEDIDGEGVFARTFSAAGAPTSGEIPVNTTTAEDQEDPSVAVDADGDFVVAWESYDQDGDEEGVFARTFSAAGAPTSAEIPVNTTTSGEQDDPSVAIDAMGNFVVAWESNGQVDPFDTVLFRRFNAAGAPLSGEVTVPVDQTNDEDDVHVAMNASGSFIVGWESNGSDDVFVRLFDAAGTPASADIRVNTNTAADHMDISVAMQSDGDFVVAWEYDTDGDYYGVLARAFAADGTPTSGEVEVNQQTFGDQEEASVAVNDDGDVVIVFDSGYDSGQRPGGDYYDVIARQFTLNPAAPVPVDSPAGLAGLVAGAGLVGAAALRRRRKKR